MDLAKHQHKQIWAIRKGFGDQDDYIMFAYYILFYSFACICKFNNQEIVWAFHYLSLWLYLLKYCVSYIGPCQVTGI